MLTSIAPHRLSNAGLSTDRAVSGNRGRGQLAELLLGCGVPAERLVAEMVRAAAMGSDLIDLGLAEGWLSEEILLRELAARLDAQFIESPPQPLSDPDLGECVALRSYRAEWPRSRKIGRVFAPSGSQIRALLEGRLAVPNGLIMLTSHQALLDRLMLAKSREVVRGAQSTLPPLLSTGPVRAISPEQMRVIVSSVVVVLVCLAGILIAAPQMLLSIIPLTLGPIYTIAAIITLIAAWASGRWETPATALADAALPSYTILVPLYREARVVDDLLARLGQLDYPRDRLEIFLLAEADDRETLKALALAQREKGPGTFRVLTIPAGEPRTKPRALNAALPFARGDLLVVYDAEDAPEPDQLRLAAAAFAVAPERRVCLQARLAITNAQDGVLPWRFAIDYAALFDVIKAGMAKLGWPVPLGGSSNHFRLAALKRVGAWDAWNVTEDADLGVRLARLGYEIGDLESTTWEEAPPSFGPWMNQRTRWMKGWMQTLLVHAREPRRIMRELGLRHSAAIGFTTIAVVFGALFLPLVSAALVTRLLLDIPIFAGPLTLQVADGVLVTSVSAALGAETLPALIALFRRRSFRLAPMILFAPITHLMISAAAWRAAFQLATRPYHWDKTPHGLMRKQGGMGVLAMAPLRRPSETERPETGNHA
jgi:cellulose synthase/poly-beta-1,6-N-acetylglucosamine synthase-like glycosyltransferase